VENEAISDHGGSLVKRLGDGSMSVFGDVEDAVRAALDVNESAAGIDVAGYSPTLRAGVHLGRPRRVGNDYLGVDVNIAARIAESAKGGEVLLSGPAQAALDAGRFRFGRRRRLREPGAPRNLSVRAVAAADS
jgi:adenylate cyclase